MNEEANVINKYTAKFQEVLTSLQAYLNNHIVTKPNLKMLSDVFINYHGSRINLNQVAGISLDDEHTIMVTPWDASSLKIIESAIAQYDKSFNINTTNKAVYIKLPILTQARRIDMVKLVKQHGEKARIAMRNLRLEAKNELKDLQDGEVHRSEDDKRLHKHLQELVDNIDSQIEHIITTKQQEISHI